MPKKAATKGRRAKTVRHAARRSRRDDTERVSAPRPLGIDWAAEIGRTGELPSEAIEDSSARKDSLRELLGEHVIVHATSDADAVNEIQDEVVPEEVGGPFIESSAEVELDCDPDPSNPPDAEPEPLPRVMSDSKDLPD